VVTGIDNATALNLGNQFQQESIFSSKDGLMFGDGRIVPLDGDMVKGPDARKRKDLTIMNVGGRKVSMYTGLDELKTSYGKNFNSDNIHKLDESDPNHDSEVFQGLTKDRKRALGFAFKLLNSIGGLNVTVVRNSKAMEAQLEAIGQDPSKKMSSFFRGSNKTIYVNLETARGNTLFHEIIHPMVDFIKKTDPALYERIEAEVQESGVKRRVMKDGRRMKGSYLDWALNNYTTKEEVEAYYNTKTNQFDLEKFKKERPERFSYITEEAFAEMMGDAAYGHFVNSQSKLSRIREVIKAMLSRLGITSPFDNVEAIDLNQMSLSNLRTDLAEALVNGRKINVGGVEFEVGDIQADKDKVNESIKFQVDKLENNSNLGVVNINIPDNTQTQEIRFQAPEFYPNFDVSKVKRGSIKEFNGQKALLMLTDRSASGMVVSPTGVKHEFDGGVFYPYQEDTGVWAFSDKAAATRMINAAKESDGLVFLTAMAPGSIDGSVNMFDYVMKELDQAIKDKRATKKEVVEFLNKKMTIKSFDSKAKDQGIKTSKIKSVKEFSNIVLSMPQAFGVRKDIIRKSIQSKIFEKWGIPSMKEIYNTVNQDIIKDLKGNPIVSAIRIDVDAGYVDSRLDDKIKDHPTYPYVVKGEPLMIFDESVDASEVWDELNLADKFLIDSRTGEKLSEGTTQARRQRKIEMARPVVDIRMQAPEVAEEYVNDLDQKIKSTRNSKELQRLLDIKSGLAFRSGDLTTKAESKFKMRQGRSTGHFGTGFYFFSDLNRAKAYDDRRVSVINLNNYNLAPGTIKLHDALKSINNNSFDRDVNKYEIFGREIKEVESITGVNLTSEQRSQFVNDINSKLNDPNNIDSPSTLIMKSLGFEGIDSRYNKDTDNSTYGTVIYDIKSDQVGDIRMQAPQAEGETNVYTSGLTTIAFNIADKVIEADYKAGKYLSKILSKTGADKGKGYKVRLSQLLGKSIGEHSNAEVKEIMVLSRGNLNAEILRVSENSKDLQKALEGTDFTSDQINDLLHNMDEIKSMEDSEIKSILIEMRMHIDQLSRTLIEEEMIEGSTMFTVDENMGVYVRRSYKQFEAKGWEQTDNDIIKKAKEFLYKEAKKENPTATIKELNNIVGKNYKKLTEDKEFLYNIKNSTSLDGLNRVNSIFKEKKVIPEEIRDLWGQIDNPLFNYSNTAIKLAKTVSAERMYRDIYDIGKGKFISDSFQLGVTENELKGSKWGSLEGKFVDEEMFAVMNQVVENKSGNELLNFYMKIVLFNKKMSTVWNPGTHFKNVVGNTAFATMNGHIGFRGEMYKDAKTAFNTVRSLKDPELKAFYSKLVKLGVVNSSASLQEIRGIANDVYDSNFDLSEYLDEGRGYVAKRMAKLSRGAKGKIKKIDDRLMSLYQKEDDVWKAFGFMSEKARYIKAGLDVNLAEQMAAKNIRNLYPNYNEVPRIIRLLGRNALVGSFVAFQAESVRNSKNALALGFEEMGSNNSKIKKIGATRIAGTIATMTLMQSLQLYTIQLLGGAIGSLLAGFGFGEDDEEVEDRMMRTVMPEWDASGNIALTSRGELDSRQTEGQTQKDKYFDYINFSNVSGVGYIKDIMRLMFNDLNTNIGKESMLDILEKVYAPFLGQEMTLTVMMDAINNKGNKVYNPTDDIHMQIASIISYVGSEIGPGFVRSGLRIKDSMDADSDKVPVYEILAFFGLRVNRINVNKNMSIQTYYVYKDMIDRVGYEVLKDEDMLINTANPEGSTYDSKMDDYINSLVDVYGVGILNSIEGDDILAIFRNSRISEEVIKLVDQRAKSRYQEDYINVEAK
jgi:hypothetical protein